MADIPSWWSELPESLQLLLTKLHQCWHDGRCLNCRKSLGIFPWPPPDLADMTAEVLTPPGGWAHVMLSLGSPNSNKPDALAWVFICPSCRSPESHAVEAEAIAHGFPHGSGPTDHTLNQLLQERMRHLVAGGDFPPNPELCN